MKLVEMNWQPTVRQLRQFGITAAVALPLLAWGHVAAMTTLAAVGLCLAVTSFTRPHLVRPIFVGAMLVALPIGLVMSEVVVLMMFLATIVPLALLFKLTGRDALARGVDRGATTYWRAKSQPRSVESYFRQS